MFIIELTYKVPLEKIDAYMKAHVAYLDKYYEEGIFVTWGRKVPRTGGIIIATIENKKEAENIVKQYPFYKNKLADFRLIEFIDRKAFGVKDTL